MSKKNAAPAPIIIQGTYTQKAWTLHKGSFICLKMQPCKISDVTYEVNERKAFTLFNFVAHNIIDATMIKDYAKANTECNVPFVHRIEYKIIDISENGLLALATEKGAPRVGPDLTLSPAGLVTRTRTKHLEGKNMVVEVEFAMGKEKILAVKEII